MGNRISLDEQYIRIADVIALRGSCERAQVGCVIVKDGRIVSTGYNGLAGGSPCRILCDMDKPCMNAIHAEANAIYFAAKHGISLLGCTLYCNFSPCMKCADAIIQAGISRVIFRQFYRDDTPLIRLAGAGIEFKIHNEI